MAYWLILIVDYNSYYSELLKGFNEIDLKKLVKDVEMPDAVKTLCKQATGIECGPFIKRQLLDHIPVSIFIRILLDKLYKVGTSTVRDKPLVEVMALKETTPAKRAPCNCKNRQNPS